MAKTAEEYNQRVATLATENTYNPGSAVSQANTELAEVNAGKPTAYTSQDADNLGSLYDNIISRPEYSYDPTKDNVYQDYSREYQQAGQAATQQTKQAVQGINGGYGDTWTGRAAGQQYGEYLKTLNDILPELEQNNYNAYASETDRLNSLYELAQNRDQTAYNRYRDQVSDWQTDRDYAATQADNIYSRDYQNYSDAMNNAMTLENWERDDANTAQSDAYDWALKLIQQGILPNSDILATAGISSTDAVELAKKYGYKVSSGSGSGSSSGKKSSGTSSNSGSGNTGNGNPLSY